MSVYNIITLVLPVLSSVVTLLIANKHNSRQTDKQIMASNFQAKQQRNFEKQNLREEKKYTNKAEIIADILFIKSQNNLTKNYIMEISNANEFTANKKYEEIVLVANRIIKNLYLSFPDLVDYGYKILGQCNMIWGNEQNYFGYQADKPRIQNQTKVDLISLYDNLSKICFECLDKLKEK
ncbi:MAG: hypothetical protein J6J27_02950 [Alphaproteobacteria bacterium]|nr:hypothetical protein [Alphaproteobacteria bacterium]